MSPSPSSLRIRRVPRAALALVLALPICGRAAAPPHDCPWGVSASASSARNHAEWFPRMAEAGVRWVRLFPEWSALEPVRGQWKWEAADNLVSSARQHGLTLNGVLMGSPPGSKRIHAFPVDDLPGWSNFVARAATRYAGVIPHWEVWNEGNGGFNDGHHLAEDYARLVATAHDALRPADPAARLGLSVASFDPAYLHHTALALARQGRPGAFDTVCIHPYEIAGGLGDLGAELPFLWMSTLLRQALPAPAPGKAPPEIWITEFGRRLLAAPRSEEEEQAVAGDLIKLHVMALAQGITRMEWFEARDPAGEESGFGLLDRQGRARPAYEAYQALVQHLGATPRCLGWLDEEHSYVFVFEGKTEPVVVAWARQEVVHHYLFNAKLSIDAGDPNATMHTSRDLWGKAIHFPAAGLLIITEAPWIGTGLSPSALARARANAGKPFPWGGNFADAVSVSLDPGGVRPDAGIYQVATKQTPTVIFHDLSTGILARGDQAVSFHAHPSFTPFSRREYYVRVTVRRISPGNVGMNLFYEYADARGRTPYRNTGTWFGLGPGYGWQTHTWKLTDACFAKMWGYDFSLRPEQSQPFVIGEVEVSCRPFPPE